MLLSMDQICANKIAWLLSIARILGTSTAGGKLELVTGI
jgi:hypothetical protein